MMDTQSELLREKMEDDMDYLATHKQIIWVEELTEEQVDKLMNNENAIKLYVSGELIAFQILPEEE